MIARLLSAVTFRKLLLCAILMATLIQVCYSASKLKPHYHQGTLQSFDGKHISYIISLEQEEKLLSGSSVIINQRDGKSGRAIAIQDVHAPPEVCMDRIRDLGNYHKMVNNVKRVTPYDPVEFANGTRVTGAEFKVGISVLTFTYFLKLKFDPRYFTTTWTLDYQYSSDLDDNTGHWQVMRHPTRPGWSRILFSSEVKVFDWLPEIVINFMTKAALVESTAWVKREAEKFVAEDGDVAGLPSYPFGDISKCFVKTNEHSQYLSTCADEQAGAQSSIQRDEL